MVRLVAVGLALSVLVAWSFAAVPAASGLSLNEIGVERVNGRMWTVIRFDTAGSTFVASSFRSDPGGSFALKEVPPRTLWPSWAAQPVAPPADTATFDRWIAHGWPCRCVRVHYASVFAAGARPVSTSEVRIPTQLPDAKWGSGWAAPRDLPVVPVWAGLVVNAAVFSLLWALACWVWRSSRRARAARRRLCPACKYPRGASARCSECGALLASSEPSRGTA